MRHKLIIFSNGDMDSSLCLMALIDLIAFGAVIGVLFMYIVHIVAIIYGKVKLHRCNSAPIYGGQSTNNSCPGVTMLKPLVGEDENLYMNLKSCFDLNYPKLQILFCVQDENDPATRTVRKLMDDYPNADVQLLTCATTGGVNPKINNMLQGYKVAKYDLLWINDSSLLERFVIHESLFCGKECESKQYMLNLFNYRTHFLESMKLPRIDVFFGIITTVQILVHPNTLSQMVSDMTVDVGIAHQVPFLMNKSSFCAVLQKVYFGTQHARVYLFANALGFTCTNGMSMLLRKRVLDEVGGLQEFSLYIAEDFFISKSFADRGWKIALSSLPAMQNPSRIDLSSFFSRMVRWTRLRITMMPVIGVLEPLTECFTIGLLGCWGFYYLWSLRIWKFLLCHCFFWFVADQLLLHIMQGPFPMPPFHELTLAWLLRETWTYFIFLRGLCGREITWKNGAFRIQTGGKAYRIQGMKVEDDEHCL